MAILGTALVLLVATLMGGLAPQGCGPTSNFTPSTVALADIPGNYLGWIRAAAPRYGLDWTVIAGIYSIETDFGRLDAPGVRSGENFAGAGGPGQFLAPTWERYGVDGDGDGVKDRYNPADAIPGTANLLRQNGAPGDYGRAIFAYNHAGWYVAEVLSRAARYRGAAKADPSAASFVAVADVTPAAACANAADGASRPLHGRPAHVARRVSRASGVGDGGRPTCRARRRPDLRRRPLGPAAATAFAYPRRARPATTRTATAPRWISCPRWRRPRATGTRTAGRLASELGWTPSCGSSGARPGLPAQARDPVDRLRRLPEPRLAAHVQRWLSGAHPRVVGLRLLRLERARRAVRMGDGLPGAADASGSSEPT